MSNQTKGLAALLAAHGRNGDTELVHVNKRELAALEQLGNRHGIRTTTNPHTGLKEAFNWQSAVGGVLGGVAGTFAAPFTAGIINPYTGAALGSAAGTKLSGGSTEQALTNGLISGVTAWGMGGVSDALAEAGKETVKTGVEEGVKTGVQEAVPNALPGAANAFGDSGAAVIGGPNAFAGSGGLPTGAAPVTTAVAPPAELAPGIEAFAKPDAGAMASIDPGYYGAENIGSQGVNTYTSQGTKEMVAAGANPNVTSSVAPGANTLTQSGTNADYWSNVGKGLGSLDTPGKAGEFAVANKGNLIAAGAGGYGIATAAPADQSTGTTDSTGVDMSLPGTEVYYTPTGERRTRVIDRPRYGNVNMAEGGLTFSDYDAADVGSDGGYAPGGLAGYANGGVARFGGGGFMGTGWGEQNRGGFSGLTESLQPGGAFGKWHGQLYGALGADQIMPGGAMGSLIPGANQFEAKKREEEEKKRREEEAGIAAAAKAKEVADFNQKWSTQYGAPVQMAAAGGAMRFAEGGIAQLGQLLSGQNNPNVLGQYAGAKLTGQLGNNAAGTATAPTGPISMPSGFGFEGDTIGDGITPSNPALRASGSFQPSYAPTTQAPQVQTGASSLLGYNTAGGGQSGGGAQGAFPLEGRYGIIKMAGGGALGHYSDGGQMLRGPGDGVSDSIPASIEGKRPARLADGEFVIPARAVSELGNGSTEAGSKQLYAMLDRIAKKRKKGSGLAYQANPKKLMPV